MKKNFLAMVAVALLAGPMAANAVPITVSAGESVLWNFDLSGQSPAAPYTRGDLLLNLARREFNVGRYTFLSDLDGGGTQFLLNFDTTLLGVNSKDSEWLDGAFSLLLTITSGSITLDPCFTGFSGESSTACVDGAVVTAVPEPATLALFGFGLAGLGFARRRRATN